MARQLSATARRAIFASQTGEVFVGLLTLSHPMMHEPIRVCSDSVDTTSGGHVYQAFPFQITMPAEREDGLPRVQLRICNVDRRVVEAARSVYGEPMSVEFSVVLASSPDVIECGPFAFALEDIGYDALTVEGSLAYEDFLNEAFPEGSMDPNQFPGLF